MPRKTKDFAAVIRRKLAADPKLAQRVDDERLSGDVASAIVALRMEAGLTQLELANRIGTQQPVIARLEDTEYDGHSLTMLKRIAASVGKRVTVQFLDSSAKVDTPVTFYNIPVEVRWSQEKRRPTIAEPKFASTFARAVDHALVA